MLGNYLLVQDLESWQKGRCLTSLQLEMQKVYGPLEEGAVLTMEDGLESLRIS